MFLGSFCRLTKSKPLFRKMCCIDTLKTTKFASKTCKNIRNRLSIYEVLVKQKWFFLVKWGKLYWRSFFITRKFTFKTLALPLKVNIFGSDFEVLKNKPLLCTLFGCLEFCSWWWYIFSVECFGQFHSCYTWC